MANPHRGEVSFEAEGRTYTMVFNTNTICELEEETGQTIQALGGQLANPGMRLVRQIVWAGLRKYHPGLSMAEAGDVIDAVGAAQIGEIIGRAFTLAFPEAPGKSSSPRKAGRGGAG
jgi:hypothetical protein